MHAQDATDLSPPGPDEVWLRILATSDLHAHLLPHHYGQDRPCDTLGLARTARLIERLRAGVPGAVLLDNGDFLLGSALGDHIAETGRWQGPLHPVIAAMNLLGYDAATLGNHEFDHGLAFLTAALAGAAFPVASANFCAAGSAEGDTLLPPHVLIDRRLPDGAGRWHDVRLGVIGFLPPQTAAWNAARLAGEIETPDILSAARLHLPRLRAAGADVVVALAHSGIGGAAPEPGMENAATALAGLEGIDAVVAGHAHLAFPAPRFAAGPGIAPAEGRLCGKPAVMPGAYGSHLGAIDLILRQDGNGWAVARSAAALHPISARTARGRVRALVDSRADVAAAAAADHAAARRALDRVVGQTPRALCTHFALVADGAAMRLVAAAQAAQVVRSLAAGGRGGGLADLPLLSAVAPFRAGGRGGPDNFTEIPPGPLRLRHLHDLYAFPNEVRAVLASGAELVEWLERSASIYRQVLPGAEEVALIDRGFPSYSFDMIAGLSYTIDVSVPARYDRTGALSDAGARRIRDLRRGGLPVRADDRFVVATNSYRIATWTLDPRQRPQEIDLKATASVRDALVAYVAAADAAAAPVLREDPGEGWDPGWQQGLGPGWRLALPQGASAILETAPEADPSGLAGTGLEAEAAGHSEDGFLRLRLRASRRG